MLGIIREYHEDTKELKSIYMQNDCKGFDFVEPNREPIEDPSQNDKGRYNKGYVSLGTQDKWCNPCDCERKGVYYEVEVFMNCNAEEPMITAFVDRNHIEVDYRGV